MSTNDELVKKISDLQGQIETALWGLTRGTAQHGSSLCSMDRELAYLREEMNETIRAIEITCSHCGKINMVQKWKMVKGNGLRGVHTIRCPNSECRTLLKVEVGGRAAGIFAYAYPPLKGLFAGEKEN